MTRSVVTRFAPSPTGYLHIGGARTALYNLLYARHRNGKFLLRIEDTDQSRHIEDAVTAIRDGLLWLGIEWDEEHRQSAARQKHQAEAERLVAEGKAYRCYTTPEEMTAIKASHPKRRAVSPFRPAAGTSASTTQAADTQTGSYVIRLITPEHGHTTLDDLVQGAVTLNNEDIDDFVLLRSDGTPTYMHAVVVDDNASGVTTIIRGDDHLVNGVKHQLLYEALGYALPEFAHIPLIHAEDGTKLSKRHGAVGIEQFQAQGYLPEAIVNWLMRMGWGYGDREMFSLADASALFAIADVGKSPARLDYAKLNSFNCHYIRERLGHDRLSLVALVRQHTADAVSDEQIDAALELITPRHQTINGIGDEITSLYTKPPTFPLAEPKAAKAFEEFLPLASKVTATFHDIPADEWNAETIKGRLHLLATSEADGKFGKVARPIRAALLGRMDSPDLAQSMALLGKEVSVTLLESASRASNVA